MAAIAHPVFVANGDSDPMIVPHYSYLLAGLIRREDYDVDIMAGSAGARYMSGYTQVAGIMLPTRHRILPRTPAGQALTEPLLISIDLSDITFT